MKKIGLYIALVAGMFSATSCEKFLDVNDDKDQPFTTTPDSLLPAVIGRLALSQFKAGETAAYFTQHVTTQSAWSKYKTRWDYVDANRIAEWRYHYHDVSVNALHVIEASSEERLSEFGYDGKKADNYKAVAALAYATSTLMTTDLFGDIAYTEAFKGLPYAKYDKQQDIYNYILNGYVYEDGAYKGDHDGLGIAKAIEYCNAALANKDGNVKMTLNQDAVYGGDMQKWKAYAYALKARTLLHLTPNVNKNYKAIIEAAELALDNGFVDAAFDYGLFTGNDWTINPWGPKRADPGAWETTNNTLDVSAPSQFMLTRALHYDAETNVSIDPRLSKFMTARYSVETEEVDADGNKISKDVYLGIRPGVGKIGSVEVEQYPDLYNSYMTKDDGKLPFLTREELYLILAEAEFEVDKNKAFDYYILAIEAHMNKMGVDAAEVTAYKNSSVVPSKTELTIGDIMMQKYLVTYLQPEAWTDMRRYGYNNTKIYVGLQRPNKEALADYFQKDESWIQRLPYDTQTEEIYNKPQLVEMGAYQNPEWLKKKMFWAK